MRVLAASESTRTVERLVLAYTPLWIAVVAVVMLTRPFARFGDRFHLALGLGLAAPVLLLPFFVEREQPLSRRYAARFALFVGLFSLLQCFLPMMKTQLVVPEPPMLRVAKRRASLTCVAPA